MVECQARGLEVRVSNTSPGSNFSLEFREMRYLRKSVDKKWRDRIKISQIRKDL